MGEIYQIARRGLLMMALALGACAEPHAQAQAPACYEGMDAETRERLRGVMLVALDEAFQAHVAHLFEVWMRDDKGQPGRAAVGTQRGVAAYLHARAVALKWSPQSC